MYYPPQGTAIKVVGKCYLVGDAVLHSHDAELTGSDTDYARNKTITLEEFAPS